MKRFVLAACLVAALGACTSSVIPVTDQAVLRECLQTRTYIQQASPEAVGEDPSLNAMILYTARTMTRQGGMTAAPDHMVPLMSPVTPTARVPGTEAKTALNQFLDCYAGPVDEHNLEARVLRGFIVLTVMAQWADHQLEQVADSGDRRERALTVLEDVETAATMLYAGSNVILRQTLADAVKKAAAENKPLALNRADQASQDVEAVRRTLAVFQVAYDGAAIGVERTRDRILSLVSLIATRNLTALNDLLEDALQGSVAAYERGIYGAAFQRMAGRTLAPAGVWTDRSPTAQDWRVWQVRLERACASLSHAAGTDRSCRPDATRIESYLKRNHPVVLEAQPQ